MRNVSVKKLRLNCFSPGSNDSIVQDSCFGYAIPYQHAPFFLLKRDKDHTNPACPGLR